MSDPALVAPEYNVSGRWADYALLGHDGKPAAFIEAKRFGESLASHRMQMVSYANMSGVPYTALTDGNHWELYRVFDQAPIDDRRILNVSVVDRPAYESALQLLLLWRPNLTSRQPMKASEPIFAVNPEPAPVEPPVPVQPATSPPPAGWVALSSFTNASGDKQLPLAIRFPDNSFEPLRYWFNMVEHTAAWLWSSRRLTAANVPVPASNQRYIVNTSAVHQKGNGFTNTGAINGTPLFVEKNISSRTAVSQTKALLTYCGVNPADVFVQAAP